MRSRRAKNIWSIDRLTSKQTPEFCSILVLSTPQSFSFSTGSLLLHFLRGLSLSEKENKRTGIGELTKSTVTTAWSKANMAVLNADPAVKTIALTQATAAWIWRARLSFAVVFGAKSWPFRRRHHEFFTKTQHSCSLLLVKTNCFHAEEMTNSLSSLWANQITEQTKVLISSNRSSASKVNGTKFKWTEWSDSRVRFMLISPWKRKF